LTPIDDRMPVILPPTARRAKFGEEAASEEEPGRS
jgi:hypothetical protein